MGRTRSTTVRFDSKEQCDQAPLLAKPNCEPEIVMDSSPSGGLHLEAVSIQGWRKDNEDAVFLYAKGGDSATSSAVAIPAVYLGALGIFDGHQNDVTSKHMAQHLVPALAKALESLIDEGASEDAIVSAAEACFHSIDEQHRAQEETNHGGTTAAIVLVTAASLYCFSVGDSRIHVVHKSGDISASLDQDHRPTTHTGEQERLASVGATVSNGRVNGFLSVTRALGDYILKPADKPPSEWAVISKPDVKIIARDPANDYGVIVGCDGVWELQNAKTVVSAIQKASTTPMVLEAAQASISHNVQMTIAVQSAIPSGCDNVSLGAIVFM